MRVCFVNTSPMWGGGEKWHFEMALQLKKRGFEVSALTHPKSKLKALLEQNDIPVFSCKIGNLSFLNFFKIIKLIKLLKNTKSEIAILNSPSELKLVGLANKFTGIKTIYRRGSAIPVKNTFINRFIFGHFIHLILSNSEETKRTILSKNPKLFDPEKIFIIYNGIDLQKYDQQKTLNLFPYKNEKIIIGNAGRLVHQKGQIFLIEIAKKLKAQGLNFKIAIAGDGELMAPLKASVEKEKLNEQIEFLGFVEDMKSFMASIDIFVLTSLWEGFGYVLSEAMTNKKPIVAFDVSSNPELVFDGQNGFLVAKSDLEQMASKLALLISDRQLSLKFGEKGRQLVEENFTLTTSANKLDKLLKQTGQTKMY
jgi:glycosyltransferase involved in cell wall biosynthesis